MSDRESDIYEDFARKPDNVDLLVSANHNRRLEEGDLLFDYADSLPEGERFVVAIPASPGRAPRKANIALRFGAVTICRPGSGMPAADAKTLPKTIRLHLVDIVEVAPPDGVASIHWRLLTTHAVENIGQARLMLDFYRKLGEKGSQRQRRPIQFVDPHAADLPHRAVEFVAQNVE